MLVLAQELAQESAPELELAQVLVLVLAREWAQELAQALVLA